MALWGNKDSKTASGTVSITGSTGAVVGSSTSFTTQAKIGNAIRVSGEDYIITKITSNTAATVRAGVQGATMTDRSGASYTLSEKPVYVSVSESRSSSGDSGNSTKVFGVDATEVHAGGDDVAEIAVVNAGTGYTEAPAVTFASGAQTATTAISGGSVTAVTVTGSGSYATAPAVTLDKARRTVATTAVNTTAETITYTAHGMQAGEALVYNKVGSGTAIAGLTTGTTYYAIIVDADTFKLATSAENATAGTAINLTGTGNNSQYFELANSTQATATAALGSGAGGTQVTHSGWVRRTVGTGGRAGRVFYETLVASGTTAATAGDQSDDIQFHDN